MPKKITKDATPRGPRRRGPMGGGHGPGAMVPGEKAKDFKGTFKKLVAYLGRYKFAVALVLIFAIASTVFIIVGPKILGQATTKIFEGVMNIIANTGSGIDFNYIGRIILILVGLYLISALFSYIQGYIMTGVSMKVTYRLREDVFAKINRLPFKYFDKTTYGEVLSFLTNDIETINQTLNQSLTQIITSVTTLIGILVMMISISWQMTLVALCIIPLSFIFIIMVVKKSQVHFGRQQEYLGHINGTIEETYGGHTVVQAFNNEE
ncbi:MAG: ABC transporter ATP-binding protein, partial [Eubacterium sp.]